MTPKYNRTKETFVKRTVRRVIKHTLRGHDTNEEPGLEPGSEPGLEPGLEPEYKPGLKPALKPDLVAAAAAVVVVNADTKKTSDTMYVTQRPTSNEKNKEMKEMEWIMLASPPPLEFQARHASVEVRVTSCPIGLSELRLRIIQTKKTRCNMCQLSKIEIFEMFDIDTRHPSFQERSGKTDQVDAQRMSIPISDVLASGENPPSETAAMLLQPLGKWLCPSLPSNPLLGRWIVLSLAAPTTKKSEIVVLLTSGNDCRERDPSSIILEGRKGKSTGGDGLSAQFARRRAEKLIPRTIPIVHPSVLLDLGGGGGGGAGAGAASAGAAATPTTHPTSTPPLPLLQRDTSRSSATTKTHVMVCHDMRGGYTEFDSCDQGCSSPFSYSLDWWHLVDIFVYFSHHLVTIPPKQWINKSHMHGTKCYGTFIVEWGKGATMCEEILFCNEKAALLVADALSHVAHDHQFDGWLINIECPFYSPSKTLPYVYSFLQRLRQRGMEISWYDSISSLNGTISYQNELNDVNAPFFQLCHSIFTNYRWDGGSPRRSAAAARKLGRASRDVFMGCDVFGRGTYGGTNI